MLQILGCGWGTQFPNPEWFVCGPKPMANWSYSDKKWHKQSQTPRPGLEMLGHPCSGRQELCISPAVGMKSTRITVWRTSKCWDLPWWLWSSLYSTLKELWGKYIPSAPQEREAILLSLESSICCLSIRGWCPASSLLSAPLLACHAFPTSSKPHNRVC